MRPRARWWGWWLSNCQCWDCISRRCSMSCWRHIRPRQSFRCRSTLPCASHRPAGALVVLVAVQLSVLGSYRPPVLKMSRGSAPDNHFAASPYCRVMVSGIGRISDTRWSPRVYSAATQTGDRYHRKRVVRRSLRLLSPALRFGFSQPSIATLLQPRNSRDLPRSSLFNSVIKRSASTGLARHSAIIKGSLPSAAKSSRNASGCLVCWPCAPSRLGVDRE